MNFELLRKCRDWVAAGGDNLLTWDQDVSQISGTGGRMTDTVVRITTTALQAALTIFLVVFGFLVGWNANLIAAIASCAVLTIFTWWCMRWLALMEDDK